MIRLTSLVLGFVTLVAVAGDADAHRRGYYRRRAVVGGGGTAVVVMPGNWYGGIGLFATKVVDQRGGPEQLEDGAGLSVYAGIRLNDRLALEVNWMGSFHNPATVTNGYWNETDYLVLEGLTADAKIHLDRSGNLDPFVQGGVGFYWLGSEHFGLDAVGTGFQLGGGFDLWLGEQLTLGLRGKYHGISMGPPDRYDDGDSTYISAVTVEGNITLHF